jgi:hypothetical protein
MGKFLKVTEYVLCNTQVPKNSIMHPILLKEWERFVVAGPMTKLLASIFEFYVLVEKRRLPIPVKIAQMYYNNAFNFIF